MTGSKLSLPDELSQRDIADFVLRQDFLSFVEKVFSTLRPSTEFIPNWHLEVVCRWVYSFVTDEHRHFVLNLPPRSLKSIICSIALPAYLLGKNPAMQIICVSYSMGLADSLAKDTRTIMRSKWYQRLFPRTAIARNPEEGIFTTAGGCRRTASVGGAVTGHGADFGIVDDPIKPADVLSDAIRTSTNEWLIGTFLSRANDKRISKTLVVQQRLDVNDASAVFLRLDDTNHLNLPAIADRDQRHTLGPRREYLWKQGEPLQTVREDLQVLAKERKKIGERNFQAQYLQQPLPLDGGILKWSWFQFFDERPTMSAGDRHIFSWDTAVTDGGASAYSACTEWIVRGRYYYLVNLIRERLLYPEIKQTMLRQAKEYPRAIILVEDAVSGQSVRQDLRSVGINVIGIKPEGSKEQRAALASDQIEAGNVFLPRHASWSAEFQAECLAFPSGKYKDQVDSMSQAILWVEKKRHNSGTTLFGSY